MTKQLGCTKLGCALPLSKGRNPRQVERDFKKSLMSSIGKNDFGLLRPVRFTTSEQRIRRSRKEKSPARGILQSLLSGIGAVERAIPGAIAQLKTGYHVSVETRTKSLSGRHLASFSPEVIELVSKSCQKQGGYPMFDGAPIAPEAVSDWGVCPYPLDKLSVDAVEINSIRRTEFIPTQERQVALAPRQNLASLANTKYEEFNARSQSCLSALKETKWRVDNYDVQGSLQVAFDAKDEQGKKCNIPLPIQGKTTEQKANLLAFNNLVAQYCE